jgi:hypothetical protein
MITEHEDLIKKYLVNFPMGTRILFFDTIDNKRIDLDIWHEKTDGNIYISGDESEIYEFSELELILLFFVIPIVSPTSDST